ncbi:aromatic amino acid transport family protein [Aliidiomarina maris]|uniref:Aromatic amino acid permease n=1 Tax=Aliidiomarina maris TaxID=531312 RepID=A0A327WV85_9GAMM|nr:aromatic amino acid transport family protein [Aliidiomarina maris]RAJ96488.1 tyrosine-specific transport protein [Aliidiomarina maris]RUO23761.1 tyrosine transporter TyrP [Aliidiomarina maris]
MNHRNRIIGSIFILAGTTIGAGMLALPLTSAGLGFPVSVAIMVVIWALMAYTGMLMLELHQHVPVTATLHGLAEEFLGWKGRLAATVAMLFLLYALCAAYIAGGGALMQQRVIGHLPAAPEFSGVLVFTLIIGLIVSLGTSKVDIINRILFVLKLIVLLVTMVMLTPEVAGSRLLDMPLEQGLLVAALPVIFTSFGFHSCIPSLVRYLNKDMAALKKIVMIGSSLPLVVYIIWQALAFGAVGQADLMQNSNLPQFVNSIAAVMQSDWVEAAIYLFADLALATSFLGVSLGLFDFLAEKFKRPNNKRGRTQTGLITFIPPLIFALFYPQGFIMALGYAAIALVIIAIVLPVLMVQKVRRDYPQANFQAVGGTPALYIALVLGVLIIVAQLAVAFNLV